MMSGNEFSASPDIFTAELNGEKIRQTAQNHVCHRCWAPKDLGLKKREQSEKNEHERGMGVDSLQ